MKTIAIIVLSLCCVGAAMAQSPTTGADAGATCKTTLAPKNLHGAAQSSASKKCCTDAAKAQKLHGAAESSYVKACISAATSG